MQKYIIVSLNIHYVSFFLLTSPSASFVPSEKMARAIAEETQQLETDLNEERSRYQNLLTEHLRLEEKYDDLKEEMVSSVRNKWIHTVNTYESFTLLMNIIKHFSFTQLVKIKICWLVIFNTELHLSCEGAARRI